jgi:phage gp45-like
MNLQGLANRLERLEQRLDRRVGAVVEFTTLARVNTSGADDQANVAGNPTDRQRPVRRVAPWGLSGRPPAGVLAAVVKAAAGAFNGLVVGIATDRYGPQNLNEGETCLWNKGVARVLLDQNDKITIQSGGTSITIEKDGKVAISAMGDVTVDSQGQIKLAGGGAGIARDGDSVKVSIPANSFVVSVAGQATGTLNANAVDVTGTITKGSSKAQSG